MIATYEGAPDGALAAIAAIVLRLSSRCSSESVSQQNFYQDVKEDNGVFGFIGEVFSFWWMIIKACCWILKAALWIVFFIVKWIKRKRTLPENSGCTGKKQTGQKQIIISAKASGESSDTCKKRRKKRRKRRKPKLGVILALILCLSLAFFAVSIRVAYPPSEHKTRPGTFVVAGALDSWSLADLPYTQNFDTNTLNQMN